MNPIEIIGKYYTPGSKLFDIMVIHGRQVAKKALDAADRVPDLDMCPVSIEEQIICYADKFFSKNRKLNSREKSVKKVLKRLEKYGHDKVLRFQSWVDLFTD
ncbi:MAG: hypothetical protein JRI92_14620 [Deltaproteobacteria bacterium]|nr:hypothetical protein [Deltaproteobacteria bacterium]